MWYIYFYPPKQNNMHKFWKGETYITCNASKFSFKNELLWLCLHMKQLLSSTGNTYHFSWVQSTVFGGEALFLCMLFGGFEDWAQDLREAKHTFYHWAIPSSTQVCVVFRHWQTIAYLPLGIEKEIFMEFPISQSDDDTCCPVSCSREHRPAQPSASPRTLSLSLRSLSKFNHLKSMLWKSPAFIWGLSATPA